MKIANAALLVAALSIGTSMPAASQTGQQILRAIIENARQGQSQSQQQFTQPVSRPTIPVPDRGVWPTKQRFLEYARTGGMLTYVDSNQEQAGRLAAAVYYMMVNDMAVPAIPEDCRGNFRSQTSQLISAINRVNQNGLSDNPPDFAPTNFVRGSQSELVQRHLSGLRDIGGGHTLCETVTQGRPIPHPYQAALIQLGMEYEQATYEFVMAEQVRRREVYRQTVAAQKADEQQRQTAQRAAEQQRIDAEAARIRADEQRRAAKEKARIGG